MNSDSADHLEPLANKSRGAALVEFAVVLPVLLMVLFGIIEFGIAYTEAQAIEATAREAGRLASLSTSTLDQINDRANETLGRELTNPLTVGTSITPNLCGRQTSGPRSVTVTVSEPHEINIPLVNVWHIDLEATAVFRCES